MDRSLVRVVLVGARNPLNIGAAARAMSNFGFTELRLVKPYDVAYREARSAVGADEVLQRSREFETVAEAVADCTLVVGTSSVHHRVLKHPLYRLELGARLVREQLSLGPVAILFGSEKFGLSNEDLAHCHWIMRIPTREQHPSMNLGQAVAVCLYELIRDDRVAVMRTEKPQPATAGALETLTQVMLEVLKKSGYVHQPVEGSGELRIRRLVRRLELSEKDAGIWLGIFRQVLWKLDHP